MLAILSAVLGALVLFSFVGVAALVWVPRAQRAQLVPAIPVLGAACLVVLLHLTGIVLPVRVGVWVIVAVCVVLIVIAAARGRFRSFVDPRSLLHLLLMLATGAAGAVIALWPSLLARSPLAVQASPNNDAFYYVGVADWFSDHSILQTPSIGQGPSSGLDSPAFGPAAESIRLGLRVGQDILHAGVSEVLLRDPVATFTPLIAVYVLMIPASAWVLGAAFRLSTTARVLLGGALVSTFTVVNQVQNQNAASILGIAIVPLVIGVVALRVLRRDDESDDTRVPLWISAVALSALVGTYTEYAVFAGAALAGLVLIGSFPRLAARVTQALAILALAVAVGPLIWVRAVYGIANTLQMTTSDAGVGLDFPGVLNVFASPYRTFFAVQPATFEGDVSRLALICSAVVAALGLVMAVVSARSRGLAIGILVAIGGAAYIGTKGNDYVTGRAADMVTPLIISGAVIGWAAGVAWLRRGMAAKAHLDRVVVVAGALVAAGLVALSAIGSWKFVVIQGTDDRIVTNDFADAARWVSDVQQDGGADVTVATAGLFGQLWISESLRQLPDISYVSLRGDLGYRSDLSMTSFWDGERDRYVLVGPGAYFDSGADVMEQNSTFALLDLSAPAIVAVPVVDVPGSATWGYGVDAGGAIPTGGRGAASVELLTSRQSLDTGFMVVSVGDAPIGSTVQVLQDGAVVDSQVVTGDSVMLELGSVVVQDGTARVSVEVAGRPDQVVSLRGVDG